jgi:hypothetical protein
VLRGFQRALPLQPLRESDVVGADAHAVLFARHDQQRQVGLVRRFLNGDLKGIAVQHGELRLLAQRLRLSGE